MRSTYRGLAALAPAIAALLGAAPAIAEPPPAGPPPVPCHAVTHSPKHYCTFYPAGNGITAGAPVQASSGARVGFLNQGTNWVICERTGKTLTSGKNKNYWWAWTEANDRRWGWVNALYGHGGKNFGDFQGVPGCGPNVGYPPGGAPAKPPVKKPKPKGPSLRQRADVIMNMTYNQFDSYEHHVHPAPFDWHTDGCSSPTPGFLKGLFRKPCELHDFGYRNYGHGRLELGKNEGTRAAIDHRFLQEMVRRCNDGFKGILHYPNKVACLDEAGAIYTAVRNGGRGSFYH